VAGRYAGRMHSWDVVNEAVLVTDGRADGLRDSPWLRLVGEDYIEEAFQTARNADPQALLAYNDYGIEGEDDASEKKRAALLVLLRRLKARHVPVDAMGIQSHLTAGKVYGPRLAEFAAVAATYGSYLDMALREPALRVVMTWGITDRKTWLNSEGARPDKLPQRCLPFGTKDGVENAPKAAFFAVRNSFDKRRVG
jgi:endo-1,4-beta-xylanase